MRKFEAVSNHLNKDLIHPSLIGLDHIRKGRIKGDLELDVLGFGVSDKNLADFIDRLLKSDILKFDGEILFLPGLDQRNEVVHKRFENLSAV